MYKTGTRSVDAVGKMHLEGNIIPHLWYKHIRFPSGKPDLNSIIILSEIVYWHRPTIQKDEYTGAVIGAKKKFKADLLQRSYDSFSEQFGMTKRQARESIIRLEELKLLERVFRTVPTDNGPISNVLYIYLNAENLQRITYSADPYDIEMSHPPHQEVGGPTSERQTYTEITTDITTTTAPPISLPRYFEQVMMIPVNKLQMDSMYAYLDDFNGDEDIIKFAIKTAADKNKRNFAFVEYLMREWHQHQVNSVQAAINHETNKFAKPQFANATAKPRNDFSKYREQ